MEVTNERKRDGGVAAPPWWPKAAADAKRDRSLVNERIAVEVARVLGVESMDVSRVTRCLNGSTATIPMMDAISTVLGIPSPIVVAETRDEAQALAGLVAVERRRAKALAKVDAATDAEEAEIVSVARRQRGALVSTNGGTDGRTQGGVGSRRRNAR